MIYLFHLLTIPLAIIYSHIAEWVIHKYILHGLGKNQDVNWGVTVEWVDKLLGTRKKY
jgi:hypothetical protein